MRELCENCGTTMGERVADVAIVMGSDSDWPTMESAATTLTDLGISYEVELLSAHRMPEEMMEFG